MKKHWGLGLLVVASVMSAQAYTPKLLLLGSVENGRVYVDQQSIGDIEHTKFRQAVIYEKYDKPMTDQGSKPYRSTIQRYVVGCKTLTIAVKSGDFYTGLTSNSEWAGMFNDATSHDGDTGEVKHKISNLDFFSKKELKEMRDDIKYTRITPLYNEVFKAVCLNRSAKR